VILLPASANAWDTKRFKRTFSDEVEAMDNGQLPLQQGLSQSSVVSETDFNVVILNISDTSDVIHVKTGIFYAGVIAGCSCADDPTPLDEQTEHCELLFKINKFTGETKIILLSDDF